MDDPVKIPFPSKKYPGHFALVDADDAPRVLEHRWHMRRSTSTIYAGAQIPVEGAGRVHIPLHRFIMDPPPGLFVDHINGDGLDCRRNNMRFATRMQNAQNTRLQRSDLHNYYSSYKGVTFTWSGKPWRALITANKRRYVVGNFATEIEAARAYDEAARRLHGEFANVNFKDG